MLNLHKMSDIREWCSCLCLSACYVSGTTELFSQNLSIWRSTLKLVARIDFIPNITPNLYEAQIDLRRLNEVVSIARKMCTQNKINIIKAYKYYSN
jgi:hypothetical protein